MTRLMVNRDFPVEVTKGSDRERVAELTRASAFFTFNDVAKRLGTVMSNPQISGVTDPSAASVGFEMSIPTAEEARAVREIHSAWDNVMSAIGEEGVDWFLAEYRRVRSRQSA